MARSTHSHCGHDHPFCAQCEHGWDHPAVAEHRDACPCNQPKEPERITVTVSIGRNIGDEPMSATRWEDFRTNVERILGRANATFHVNARHHGEWEGNVEEGATYVAEVDSDKLNNVRRELDIVRRIYKQDAIALTTGQTELIGS